MPVLPANFFNRDPKLVARELIGTQLVRRSKAGTTAGIIVETEAYLSANDTAAHSFKGINRKNASMFGLAGRAYVYTIHARQCFNIVTEGEGIGSAVLIRAIEPIHGEGLMAQRRQTNVRRDLCRGPARLCEAMSIGRQFDGWNLNVQRRLWIEKASPSAQSQCVDLEPPQTSIRIGVTSAEDLRLRFFAALNPYVSGPKWLNEGRHKPT